MEEEWSRIEIDTTDLDEATRIVIEGFMREGALQEKDRILELLELWLENDAIQFEEVYKKIKDELSQ